MMGGKLGVNGHVAPTGVRLGIGDLKVILVNALGLRRAQFLDTCARPSP